MKTKTWGILFAGMLVAALSAAGCARGIATGGGTIPSIHPDTRGATTANFGFWGDSCGDTTVGNFNYHDKSAGLDYDSGLKGGGLKMLGPVDLVCDCMQAADEGGEECAGLPGTGLCALCQAVAGTLGWVGTEGYVTAIRADYFSTNPKIVGQGEVLACVVDNGEGAVADADDRLAVKVLSGPYEGYINGGEVSGNIQAYPCPEPD
jgi:hypothetical protein